jgi:hypothetical protein
MHARTGEQSSEYAQPTPGQIEKFNREIRYVGCGVFSAAGEIGDGDRASLAGEVTAGSRPRRAGVWWCAGCTTSPPSAPTTM